MAALDAGAQVVVNPMRTTRGLEGAIFHAKWMLDALGIDRDKDGMRETPGRLVRLLAEMMPVEAESLVDVLSAVFEEKYDEMVIVRELPFWSLCEHHLMPFHGRCCVGYLPNGKVVGLSKIPRALRVIARRPQIQERMTRELADGLNAALQPRGVGVVIRASHTCMSMRGIESAGEMVTSALLGEFQEPEVRAEFLKLAGG
jgi:GTP cyclohydrolase I